MRRILSRLATLVAVLSLFPVTVQAAWYRAETDRFIIYADGREETVREYARKLHAFDAALRVLHPSAASRPPGHKLEVFLVRGTAGIRRVDPNVGRYSRGFYSAGPARMFAVAATGDNLAPEEILFHEYAHHFMMANFPAAYPTWFVEGWAEYFMTAEIAKGQVRLGGYNESRAYWLFNAAWIPMEEVLGKPLWEFRPLGGTSSMVRPGSWSTTCRARRSARPSLTRPSGRSPKAPSHCGPSTTPPAWTPRN
jgi:hypothetical protein